MKRKTTLVVVILIVVLLGAIGSAYYLTQVAPQPNIQVTNLATNPPATNPVSQQVENQGRVSGTASFSYAATLKGSYYLTFDNSFSFFSSKYVNVAYSVGGKEYTTSVSIPAGQTNSIYVGLNAGGTVNGTFTTSGGSGNDVNFYIVGNTCSEQVSFSLTLVNSGSANGYANVAYQSDGTAIWTNKYYVQSGQSVPVSGTVSLQDCATHTFTAVVTNSTKT